MQGIMRRILGDNWGDVAERYSDNSMLDKASELVDDMLACQGYMEYLCADRSESKYVPFTCKSKFCPLCGKRYADKIGGEFITLPAECASQIYRVYNNLRQFDNLFNPNF